MADRDRVSAMEPRVAGRGYTERNDGAPQKRRPRRDGWTMKRRQLFLETLAGTCNITAAAQAAGMSKQNAYRLYHRDPEFRAAWDEAKAAGYHVLEHELLERMTDGVEQPVFHGGQQVGTVRRYNDSVALRLFLAHRDAVLAQREQEETDAWDPDEILEQLKQRIAEARARLEPPAERDH